MEKVFYRHMKSGDGTSYTVAAIFDDAKAILIVGVGICCLRDQYTKRIGRAIAYGRVMSALNTRGRITFYLYIDDKKIEYWKGKETEVFNAIINKAFENSITRNELIKKARLLETTTKKRRK